MKTHRAIRAGALISVVVVAAFALIHRADMQVDLGQYQSTVDEALTTAKQNLTEACGRLSESRDNWENINDTNVASQIAEAKTKMDEAATACMQAIETLETRGAEAKQAFADAQQKLQSLANNPAATTAQKNAVQQDAQQAREKLLDIRAQIRSEHDKIKQEALAKLAEFQSKKTDGVKMDAEELMKQWQTMRTQIFEQACGMLTSSTQLVPAGYGSAFDMLSSIREQLVKTVCDREGTDVLVEVGKGSSSQVVYERGYAWQNGQWNQVNLQPTTVSDTPAQTWIPGKAVGDIKMTPEDMGKTQYFLGYVCTWSGSEWKCGCRDTACTTNHWQLQSFKIQ